MTEGNLAGAQLRDRAARQRLQRLTTYTSIQIARRTEKQDRKRRAITRLMVRRTDYRDR